MSRTEIERLEREAMELQARLQTLQAAKQKLEDEERQRELEESRRLELETPVTVTVSRIDGSTIFTDSVYRWDVVELFQSVPGRIFRGYSYAQEKIGRNGFPIKEWEQVEQGLLSLPNLTIEWAEGIKEEMEWFLTAPPVEVDFDSANFTIRFGPNTSQHRYSLGSIPGIHWDYQSRRYTVPMMEGWRVYSVFEEVNGVVYTEAAKEIIFQQVEKRAELDLIAIKSDSDFITEVRGHKLRPFQRVGVEFIAATGGRVILADDTGLGKTWQYLGFTELQREEAEAVGKHFQTLVVVRPSLMLNVAREIERLTGTKPHFCLTGTPIAHDAVELIINRVPYTIISYDTLGQYKIQDSDGVLHSKRTDTQGDKVFPWVELLNSVEFSTQIFDEAHAIKNPQALRTKAALALNSAPHVIPVTATPLLNRTEELWTMLRLVSPHVFKNHAAFVNHYTNGSGRPSNVRKLHEFLRPHFLRRRKSEVLPDLPPINRIQRHVEMSPEGQRTYDRVLQGVYEELGIFNPSGQGGTTMNIMSILAQFVRLKQVTAAEKIPHTVELAQELVEESEDSTSKVLIFTSFLGTANEIARRLGPSAVTTVHHRNDSFYSMESHERDTLFERVRHDPSVRYIVTTEASREGHNLEFCNWVIFNDLFWTPAAHNQAEGRAYGRLSNPHHIDAYYLLAEVDFERWLMEQLENKLAITEEVVEGVESEREVIGTTAQTLIKKMRESVWSKGGT
jgi:SNF2 family DNA or RNA helicase